MAKADEAAPMIDRSKYEYERTKFVGKDGKVRTSVGKGDAVARAMLGMSEDDLLKCAKANKLSDKIIGHHGNVNPGQFRMFVGNALRAKVKRGEPVTIGKHTIEKLDQKVDIAEPAAEAKEAPAKAEKKAPRKKAA